MLLIKNGRILNPASGTDEILDILVDDGIIHGIGNNLPSIGTEIINADGKWVFPGFIDLHCHLRDPGQTYKEDIITGASAAAHGGFTSIACMPNTDPVCDSVEIVEYILNKGKSAAVNILPIASITKGMRGEEITDIEALVSAGACAVSEDGKSVMSAKILREAMRKSGELNIPVMSHCEDISLMGGVMNEGVRAEELGLEGIPEVCEDIIAIRDVLLAKDTGAKLHLCHNSTKNSYQVIHFGKSIGVDISGEICPHHFTLSDEDIPDKDNGNYKMSPPLRSKSTVEILKKGLSDNTYSVIATDHAPHSMEEKSKGMEGSPNGIVGLETAAALTYTMLVKTGCLSPLQMAERLSSYPAKILGIDRGDISLGKIADITIFDPEVEYEIKESDLVSKSKNMPYSGMKVQGRVCCTIVSGNIVYTGD